MGLTAAGKAVAEGDLSVRFLFTPSTTREPVHRLKEKELTLDTSVWRLIFFPVDAGQRFLWFLSLSAFSVLKSFL